MMAQKLNDNIIIFPKVKKDIPKTNLIDKNTKPSDTTKTATEKPKTEDVVKDKVKEGLNSLLGKKKKDNK